MIPSRRHDRWPRLHCPRRSHPITHRHMERNKVTRRDENGTEQTKRTEQNIKAEIKRNLEQNESRIKKNVEGRRAASALPRTSSLSESFENDCRLRCFPPVRLASRSMLLLLWPRGRGVGEGEAQGDGCG